MKLRTKIPRQQLPEAVRLATQVGMSRVDQPRTEPCENKMRVVLEPSDALTPSTPEDDGWTLVYELGGGREIDLGSYKLSDFCPEMLLEFALKSENEFRRLLGEPEAVARAEEGHRHV